MRIPARLEKRSAPSARSIMAGEAAAGGRGRPFRDLLLSVSKQLSEEDVEQLRYLADCPSTSCKQPLELLKAMRNKGMFSPLFCSPLPELLRKVDRHDLADEVTDKYVVLYPDQPSPTVDQRVCRRRSDTDPLTQSTTSLPLNSVSGDASTAQLTGDGSGSLGNIYPPTPGSSFSSQLPQTPLSGSLARSPPSGTSFSLRSTSQSSQDHSCSASSNSSCVGSHSSLNHATEAVLERTSQMLFEHVTANLSRSLPRSGVHGIPASLQLAQSTSQTLPPRITSFLPPPAYPVEGPTISEIFSDQEESGLEERRDTLVERKVQATQTSSLTTKFELKPEMRERDIEQSATPRVSMMVPDDSAGLEATIKPQTLPGEVPRSELTAQPHTGLAARHRSSPQPSRKLPQAKEKNWKKRFNLFGKHKTKLTNCLSWRVLREELGRPIWCHDDKCCISHSHKFELDAKLGRHNPKLLFQLYPYGKSSDCGEHMTMIVRVSTSEKCPPLPHSAVVHISLTVREEAGASEKTILNQTAVEQGLNLNYFSIQRVVQHCQLKRSHSKYIYFDMEISCRGLEVEPASRAGLPTL